MEDGIETWNWDKIQRVDRLFSDLAGMDDIRKQAADRKIIPKKAWAGAEFVIPSEVYGEMLLILIDAIDARRMEIRDALRSEGATVELAEMIPGPSAKEMV